MGKKFKSTKKINFKKYAVILIVFASIYTTMSILFNGKTINLKETLLTSSMSEIIREDSFISKILDINITTPENIIYSALNKVVSSKNMMVFSNEDDYFNYEESESEYVEDPEYTPSKNPLVYIYNSHQLEEYNMEVLYDYSIKPNVLIASYILKEKLESFGIPSVVETNNIKKYLQDNKLKYNYSYVASRYFAEIKLKENPTIEYMIDIHRDSASYDKTLYEYNSKKYARILFVVGLDHASYEPNLKLAESLNNKFNEYYPGFSRGISKKTGKGVNGIYNQDLKPNAILLEVGGVGNTIEEVNNSMDIISSVLSEYIGGNNGRS